MAEVVSKPSKSVAQPQGPKLVKLVPEFSMSMAQGIHFEMGVAVCVSPEVVERIKERGLKFKIV